ncbi:MAG: DUF2344 domain-containing protein [Austwickia sp.]|jgi:radical SAM-linked protein|nr:MAG: DUF2344 domain-containing protein [Austwickia sp.]
MARQRVPPGPPAAPPVQRLRLRYAKRGRLRFSSTRDFQRALERALRRAAVPMAFSSGFHPHPRISYANAAPTGTASEAEYVEIALVERVDPEAVRRALDDALPDGLDILEMRDCGPSPAASLADLLQASEWRVELPGVSDAAARAVRAEFLGLDTAEVQRMTKTGEKTLDVRAAVAALDVVSTADAACAILRVVVRHTTPAVRPDDVLTALRSYAQLTLLAPPKVTRLAQGPLTGAGVADPLAALE